jgi:hypothetical protein
MTASLRAGLEGFTFPELDPFALVDLAAQTGFSHVGVRLIDPSTNQPMVSLDDARRLRESAHERGIVLYGGDIIDIEGRTQDWAQCFSVLSESGIRRISSFCRSADLKSASLRWRHLAALALEHGVTAHIEPVSYFGVGSIVAATDLICAAPGGITVDTLHFARADDDLAVLAQAVRIVPVWLQVCDGPPMSELVPVGAGALERQATLRAESIARRLPPGAGACRVDEIVRTVLENAPLEELVLMVEAPHHEQVRTIGSAAYADLCREAVEEIITTSTSDEETL